VARSQAAEQRGAQGSLLKALAQGEVWDRYVIERELGSGAFGTVYAARDSETGQLVALKRLYRMSAEALAHFKHEFRSVQGLAHPNIVRLDGLFEHPSGWLIAMEFVEGTDLLSYVRAGDNDPGFDTNKLREAFRQLSEALSAMHEHGVLHRDLKPENVCVTAEGRVVLLDFGLVTRVGREVQSTHVRSVGTPTHMAPEQAVGESALSVAADWYAFGVCLYEALTGSLPFTASSPLAVMLEKQHHLPEKPCERLGVAVPADLENLCMGLLALRPEQRPTS